MSRIVNIKLERQRQAIARLKIEQAWDCWPWRKCPANAQKMRGFFHERLDLMDFGAFDRNEAWRQVKSWLVRYDKRIGRLQS